MIHQILIFLCYVLTILSLSVQEEFILIWKVGITFSLTYLIVAFLSLSKKLYHTLLKRSIPFLLLFGVLFSLTFLLVDSISTSLIDSDINTIGYPILLLGLFLQAFIFIYTAKHISLQLLGQQEGEASTAYLIWIVGIILNLIWAGIIGLILPYTLEMNNTGIIPILPALSIALVGLYLTIAYLGYVGGTFPRAPIRTLAFSGFNSMLIFLFLSLKAMTALFALFDYLDFSQTIDIFLMVLVTVTGVNYLQRVLKEEPSIFQRFIYFNGLLFLGLFLGSQLWISDTYFEGYTILLAFVHGVGILIGLYAVINAVPIYLSDLGIIPDEALIPLFNLTTAMEIQTQRMRAGDSPHALEAEWGYNDRRGRERYPELADADRRHKPDEVGEEDDPTMGTGDDDFDYDDFGDD